MPTPSDPDPLSGLDPDDSPPEAETTDLRAFEDVEEDFDDDDFDDEFDADFDDELDEDFENELRREFEDDDAAAAEQDIDGDVDELDPDLDRGAELDEGADL